MIKYFAEQNAVTTTKKDGAHTVISIDPYAPAIITLVAIKPTNKPNVYRVADKQHYLHNKEVKVWPNHKVRPMKRSSGCYVYDESATIKTQDLVVRFRGRSGHGVGYVVDSLEQAQQGFANKDQFGCFFVA